MTSASIKLSRDLSMRLLAGMSYGPRHLVCANGCSSAYIVASSLTISIRGKHRNLGFLSFHRINERRHFRVEGVIIMKHVYLFNIGSRSANM